MNNKNCLQNAASIDPEGCGHLLIVLLLFCFNGGLIAVIPDISIFPCFKVETTNWMETYDFLVMIRKKDALDDDIQVTSRSCIEIFNNNFPYKIGYLPHNYGSGRSVASLDFDHAEAF